MRAEETSLNTEPMLTELEELGGHHHQIKFLSCAKPERCHRDVPLVELPQNTLTQQGTESLLLILDVSGLGNLKFWITSIQFQPQLMPSPLWDGSGPR